MEEETRDIFLPLDEVSVSSAPTQSSHVSIATEESPEPATATPSDIGEDSVSRLTDRDTLVYVAGSILRRLNCPECFDGVGQFVSKETASGFLRQMIFDRSSLFAPGDPVIVALTANIDPATSFLERNIFVDKITKTTVEAFPLNFELGFCSHEHSSRFLRFFYTTLVRTVCKERNTGVAESNKAKYRKLNV